MASIRQVIFSVLLFCFALSINTVHCYICFTPKEWLDKVPEGGYNLITGIGGKWPGGVVKYHLNSTLTEKDKQQVFLAFDEYHKKTCIRFEPYSTADSNYVSIEVDNSVCGMAHVCMKGGYQFVKFGQNCRNKNNIIHQLGHTICLSHEDHHRHEGDKFITHDKSCRNNDPERKNPLVSRIYDQASQMHFGCNLEKKCGYQITSGLSVLDADYINALYKCQGCFRHRWIPKPALGLIDSSTIYSFGFVDLGGGEISPCRAFFNGQVVIGKFNEHQANCYLAFADKEYKLCDNFEVLSIPAGVRANDTEYFLAEAYPSMSLKKENALFESAVVAGRLPCADGSSSYGHGYVAFGAVPNFMSNCANESSWWSGGANRKLDVIGSAWRYKNGTRAFAALCRRELPLPIYYVLSCKNRQFGADENLDEEESRTENSQALQQQQDSPNEANDYLARKNNWALSQHEIKMALQQVESGGHSSKFFADFITGFLVLALLLTILSGILYYGYTHKRFGFFGRGFPVLFNTRRQDSFYEG